MHPILVEFAPRPYRLHPQRIRPTVDDLIETAAVSGFISQDGTVAPALSKRGENETLVVIHCLCKFGSSAVLVGVLLPKRLIRFSQTDKPIGCHRCLYLVCILHPSFYERSTTVQNDCLTYVGCQPLGAQRFLEYACRLAPAGESDISAGIYAWP